MMYYGDNHKYSKRGLSLSKKEDYKGAIREYSKVIAIRAGCFYQRAFAYAAINEDGSAIADFTAVINALRESTKDYIEAFGMERALVDAYINRGRLYSKGGDNDKALADYCTALELDSNNVKALERRAYVYSKIGEYDKTIADHTMILQLAPTAENYCNRADDYEKQGELEKAIVDYTAAIEADSKYVDAYLGRANALMSIEMKKGLDDSNVLPEDCPIFNDWRAAARLGHVGIQHKLLDWGLDW